MDHIDVEQLDGDEVVVALLSRLHMFVVHSEFGLQCPPQKQSFAEITESKAFKLSMLCGHCTPYSPYIGHERQTMFASQHDSQTMHLLSIQVNCRPFAKCALKR
mmetsp:Transcript_40836/g.67146  ORF Transcript_40836/g.67146 Transcript_40836/m.67146 type:complete len:104 (-) Transcript_40836:41-352(-)